MNKKTPVSVILPTYNRAHLLEASVESVLEQTYRNLELIIVDDGSKDNTEELVALWQKQDPRIRYVRHERNKGLAAGRNTGARAARFELIANQDSDDIWEPGKLEREVTALQNSNPRTGVAYSRTEKIMRSGKRVYIPSMDFHPTSGDLHLKLLEANFITMQTSLMKKECFEKVGGFDESLRDIEDWDFWLRVSKYYEFVFVPDIGVKIKIYSDSLTSNQKKRLGGREDIFVKHIDEFKKYPKIFARHAYSIGHTYVLMGEIERGRRYLKKAIKSRPLSIKALIAFFVSYIFGKNYKRFAKLIFRS